MHIIYVCIYIYYIYILPNLKNGNNSIYAISMGKIMCETMGACSHGETMADPSRDGSNMGYQWTTLKDALKKAWLLSDTLHVCYCHVCHYLYVQHYCIYYSILYSLLLIIDDIVTLYIYTVYHVIAIFVFFAGYSFIWQTFNLYHPHSTKCRCRSDAALDPQEKNGHGVRGGYPLVNVYKELSNMAQSK